MQAIGSHMFIECKTASAKSIFQARLLVNGIHLGEHYAVDGVGLPRPRRQVRKPALELHQAHCACALNSCDGGWLCIQPKADGLLGMPEE